MSFERPKIWKTPRDLFGSIRVLNFIRKSFLYPSRLLVRYVVLSITRCKGPYFTFVWAIVMYVQYRWTLGVRRVRQVKKGPKLFNRDFHLCHLHSFVLWGLPLNKKDFPIKISFWKNKKFFFLPSSVKGGSLRSTFFYVFV